MKTMFEERRLLLKESIRLTAVLASFSMLGYAQSEKGDSAKSKGMVLFVCEHGAARSAIASAYFNKFATERGLNLRATFRGTDPESTLTPGTVRGLLADGFDVRGWKPERVTDDDVKQAMRIITFDCMLPNDTVAEKVPVRWDGIPPISRDYRAARDSIIMKLETLVEELANDPVVRNPREH